MTGIRSRRAPLVALWLIVFASGCSRPAPSPTVPPELVDPAPSSRAQLRAALLSVYYHAWIVDHPLPQWGPVPIALERAATILAGDADRRAQSRRRRAIVKLAVYGTTRPAHRRAVGILLGPDKSDAQGKLEEVVASAKAQAKTPLEVEEAADAFLRGQLFEDTSCPATFPFTIVRYEPFLGTTWAETRFRVQRSLDATATSVDPQNWTTCNPFFEPSYVVDDSDDAVLDGCWSDDAKDPPPMKKLPIEGTSWRGRFYEHFVFDFAWVRWSWFKNLLVIDATRTDKQYRFRYELEDALCSRVLLDTAGGGFGIDGGYLEVTPAVGNPGWYEVAATKSLAFSGRPLMDLYLDLWSPILLWLLGDETVEQACCLP